MENKLYCAIGEETARGTAESTTVGFVPLLSSSLPVPEYAEDRREEFRGENWVKGASVDLRMSERWAGALEIPFFTEAGGTFKSAIAGLIEHCLGTSVSVQNGATGQYAHMMYNIHNMFDSGANLVGAKGVTVNMNLNEGAVVKNWPYIGGRVKGLTFTQEPGKALKMSVDMFGQKRNAAGTAIASPVFPAENLRCDFYNLKVYTGTITRVGTAPNYTNFTFGSATQIIPDKIVVKIENGLEDVLRCSGLQYADTTRYAGQFKVTVEMSFLYESPAAGFNPVTEYNNWIANAANIPLTLHWDTGTAAGSGDNHGLFLDIPEARRVFNGVPDFSLDKDPMLTMKFEGRLSATTGYMIGALIKNTAASV